MHVLFDAYVTSIGSDAFHGCSSLKSITIPNSVTAIENRAFYGFTSLTSVTIPNSVTSIGGYTFYGCSSLTSVTIPNSVTSIGDTVFYDCSSLTSITIPNSVTSIGYMVFTRCSSLKSINVDSKNSNYASIDGVLFNKNKTKLIAFPGGKSGSYSIPNSVTSINEQAFLACKGLTSITIPKSVTFIGYSAFDDLDNLKDVYYTGTESDWKAIRTKNSYDSLTTLGSIDLDDHSIDELLNATIHYSATTTITSNGKCGDNLTWSLNTSTGVLTISGTGKMWNYDGYEGSDNHSPWYNNKNIKKVIIDNGVTSIGNCAFDYCSEITSVVIPNTVVSVGAEAFFDCNKLTTIAIPDSVKSIGGGAFQYCEKLTRPCLKNG